jgi:hypothetical protein
MSADYPWYVLELDGPCVARDIKRAYASLAKRIRPDEDPKGFTALRAAYEYALSIAEEIRSEIEAESTCVPAKEIASDLGSGPAALLDATMDRIEASAPNFEQIKTFADDWMPSFERSSDFLAIDWEDHVEARESFAVPESYGYLNGSEIAADASSAEAVTARQRQVTLAEELQSKMADWEALRKRFDLHFTRHFEGSLVVPAQELLDDVCALAQHPANVYLSIAEKSEAFLIDLGVRHELPHSVVNFLTSYYEFETRLILENVGSPMKRFVARQEEAWDWKVVVDGAKVLRSSPDFQVIFGMNAYEKFLFWVSASVRETLQGKLAYLQAHFPKRILHAETVNFIERSDATRVPKFALELIAVTLATIFAVAVVFENRGDGATRSGQIMSQSIGPSLLSLFVLACLYNIVIEHRLRPMFERHRMLSQIAEYSLAALIVLAFAFGRTLGPLVVIVLAAAALIYIALVDLNGNYFSQFWSRWRRGSPILRNFVRLICTGYALVITFPESYVEVIAIAALVVFGVTGSAPPVRWSAFRLTLERRSGEFLSDRWVSVLCFAVLVPLLVCVVVQVVMNDGFSVPKILQSLTGLVVIVSMTLFGMPYEQLQDSDELFWMGWVPGVIVVVLNIVTKSFFAGLPFNISFLLAVIMAFRLMLVVYLHRSLSLKV